MNMGNRHVWSVLMTSEVRVFAPAVSHLHDGIMMVITGGHMH